MSTVNKSARQIFLVGGIGLAGIGAIAALCAVVAAIAVGAILATGTLRHTSQGWALGPAAGSVAASELRSEKLDPKVDTLFIAQGSGSSQTAQFTATGAWRADWTYSCPSNSGSFRVVAQSADQSYAAGQLDNAGVGAGNSNRLPAGSYSFAVRTDAGCSWSVGARPTN